MPETNYNSPFTGNEIDDAVSKVLNGGIPISSVTGLRTELSDLFTSVSSGKSLVASAITDKGVQTESDATFQTMAQNIANISGESSASNLFSTVYANRGALLSAYKITFPNIHLSAVFGTAGSGTLVAGQTLSNSGGNLVAVNRTSSLYSGTTSAVNGNFSVNNVATYHSIPVSLSISGSDTVLEFQQNTVEAFKTIDYYYLTGIEER